MNLQCVLPNFILTTKWEMHGAKHQNTLDRAELGSEKKRRSRGEGKIYVAPNVALYQAESEANDGLFQDLSDSHRYNFKIKEQNLPMFYTVGTQMMRSSAGLDLEVAMRALKSLGILNQTQVYFEHASGFQTLLKRVIGFSPVDVFFRAVKTFKHCDRPSQVTASKGEQAHQQACGKCNNCEAKLHRKFPQHAMETQTSRSITRMCCGFLQHLLHSRSRQCALAVARSLRPHIERRIIKASPVYVARNHVTHQLRSFVDRCISQISGDGNLLRAQRLKAGMDSLWLLNWHWR